MSDALTPFADTLAPITETMGFLRAPLDEVADALRGWLERIHGSSKSARLEEGMPQAAHRLEPLTGGVRPRELVVGTASAEWTALFDCGVQGGDPRSTVGYLCEVMRTHGVVVVSVPNSRGAADRAERYGARQFSLYGPIDTDFLNIVRSVSVVRDGERWRFDANGTVQDFEEVDAYQSRKITDRFTADMLRRYCAAFDLRPFDDDFFTGPSVLVTNPAVPPPEAFVLTLEQARQRWGIVDR